MERRTFIKRGLAWGAAAIGSALIPFTPARAAALFAETFTRRSTSSGWGKPWFNQRRGLHWGIAKKNGFFELPEPQVGAGRHNPNPVLALDRDVADAEVRARFASSNKNARYGLVVRATGYGDYYAAYLEGSTIRISKFGLGREKELKQASVRIVAGASYWMRFKVTGSSPVRLQAKVWKAGNKEPSSWRLFGEELSTEGPITRSGSSGFLFMHDDLTKKRARVRVDNFRLVSAQRPKNTIPEITFAFAGRVQSVNGSRRAQLVAKTDIPATVEFEYSRDPKFASPTVLQPGTASTKTLVSKAFLTGLAASETVYWRVVATSKSGRKFRGRIRALPTPPATGDEVRFCFGSCSKSFATSQSFATAASMDPFFFAHLGDFGYPESALSGGAAMSLTTSSFQDRWTRMLGPRSVTELHRKAAWLMIQDDHDYGRDNAWRETVRPFTIGAFDGLSGNIGARHFDVRYGDVHGFFVDTRINADDPAAPDGPGHSLLGSVQKDWLKTSMEASDAQLLVVFSSQPFWGGGDGLFSWKKAFATERRELIDFFGSLQGTDRRVIVCSGNSHAHYINRHSNPSGKDIIEFVSSGMDRRDTTGSTNLPDDGIIDPQRNVKSVDGFGFVRLKQAGVNLRVEFRCLDSATGRDVWPSLSVDL